MHSHTLRILSSLQRIFAIRITRANRHISTDAVLQLAGLLPIDLVLLKEHKIGKLFRLKESVTIGDDNFTPSLVDIPSSRWFLPPFNFYILNCMVVDIPNLRNDTICYYTDGSKTEDGVGASFCAFDHGNCIYFWNSRLCSYNTIFQAEAFAIYQALNWHLDRFQNRSFVIYSDSRSVILALTKFKQKNRILQDIVKLFLSFHGVYGVITWVKAHVGIMGNEKADELAKQATSSTFSGACIQLPMSNSYIRVLLSKDALNTWQFHWDNSFKGRFTYKFLPKVSLTHLFDNYCLNLFMTNRGPFPSFLYDIGKIDSPDCICSKYGDAVHYIFDCPLTINYHFCKPSSDHEIHWFSNLLNFDVNKFKICRLVKWLLNNESFLQNI